MEILLAPSVCSNLSSLAFISSTAAQKVCLGFPDRSNLYLDSLKPKIISKTHLMFKPQNSGKWYEVSFVMYYAILNE